MVSMTTQSIVAPKPAVIRRPATYEQYVAWADETGIAEWVNGEMIEYMPPLFCHQEITWFLFSLINGFVDALKLGLAGTAPFEFKLWPDGPSREPDVFYVSAPHLANLTDRRFDGPPDIAVEVISSSSIREDRVRKFSEYERAGVAEYWLIDPRPHQTTAEFYGRDGSGVFAPIELTDGRFVSTVLHGFWLDIQWLWSEQRLSYRDALQAIFQSNDSFPPDLRAI